MDGGQGGWRPERWLQPRGSRGSPQGQGKEPGAPGAEKAGFGARPLVWSQRPLRRPAVCSSQRRAVSSHTGVSGPALPKRPALGLGSGCCLLRRQTSEDWVPRGCCSSREFPRQRPRRLSLSPACRAARRASSPGPSVWPEPCTCPERAGREPTTRPPAPSHEQPGVQLGEVPQGGSHS